MAQLRVTLVEDGRDRRLVLRLPDGVPLAQLVPALAHKLGLPEAEYALTVEGRDTPLVGESTLAGADVGEGAQLRLVRVAAEGVPAPAEIPPPEPSVVPAVAEPAEASLPPSLPRAPAPAESLAAEPTPQVRPQPELAPATRRPNRRRRFALVVLALFVISAAIAGARWAGQRTAHRGATATAAALAQARRRAGAERETQVAATACAEATQQAIARATAAPRATAAAAARVRATEQAVATATAAPRATEQADATRRVQDTRQAAATVEAQATREAAATATAQAQAAGQAAATGTSQAQATEQAAATATAQMQATEQAVATATAAVLAEGLRRYQISFLSNPQYENPDIWVIRGDGSDLRQLAAGGNRVWSPDGARLAFEVFKGIVGSPDTSQDIVIATVDGTKLTNLTQDDFSEGHPAWLPDSAHVLFLSQANRGLYLVSADGARWTDVLKGAIQITSFQLSPDGTRIALVTGRIGFDEEIYVVKLDGAGLFNLTQNPNSDWHPLWSPDGRRIGFVSDRDGNWEIYVVNADGSGLINLTQSAADEQHFTWSPDGRYVAVALHPEGRDDELYLAKTDGSGMRNLTQNAGDARFCAWTVDDRCELAWSPEARELAVVASLDGREEIYLVDVESGEWTNLTQTPRADESYPAWSPDGRYMAFVSNRDGNQEIYVMLADGSVQVRLTDLPSDEADPLWSPVY